MLMARDSTIVLTKSLVADATDTNSSENCEDYEDTISIYSNGTSVLVILLVSLFGMFFFRREK